MSNRMPNVRHQAPRTSPGLPILVLGLTLMATGAVVLIAGRRHRP
ncbi:hypothetical protein [Streptomyces sp. FXY-T5]|nr:hypothetical protein [Streptomyces sp. FXY-T5]WMD02909.1 hypothetical protein Q7C01_00270 [Streptomyces sp. FXY-T5]